MNKKSKLLLSVLIITNILLVLIFKPTCNWKELFNIDCAGCGTTRMFYSILKLEFYQAFRYNPYMFILLILTIIYLIYVLICKMIKKEYIKLGKKTIICILISAIIFMILRNLPMFEYLKPTIVN